MNPGPEPRPTPPPEPEPEPHPAVSLNEVVHQRNRLGILAILAEVVRADFGYLKRTLELSDGNLGKHLQILETAGMVTIEKGYHGRRPRTWITITTLGHAALTEELDSIERLVRRVPRTPPDSQHPSAGS